MIRRAIFIALFSGVSFLSFSQVSSTQSFKDFDVSLTTGSIGISVEAASNVSDWCRVRAGVSWMPTLHRVIGFHVGVENDDAENTKFYKMANLLNDITGFKVDNVVHTDCYASFANAKVMFDVLPFENKDWHFTVGFYWGNKTIGRAINTTEDMTSTLAVGIYNQMYDKAVEYKPLFGPIQLPSEYRDALVANGRMGMQLGVTVRPTYYQEDVDVYDVWGDLVETHKKGDVMTPAGTPYMMVPDEDGTVRAWAKVNSFKPYLGFGWEHSLKSCPEWRFGVDAGIVFWGGVPNVYTHDGTSLTKDVEHIAGKPGDIISFVKKFPVYPLLEIKLTRKIF